MNTRLEGTWRSNHSRIWLPFAVPFLLAYFRDQYGELVASGMIFLTLLAATYLYRKERKHSSWKRAFFIPLLIFLGSTSITLLAWSEWHTVWSLMAMALSAGWLWRIEAHLAKEQPLELREWSFSTRLFGLGSLALLLFYIVFSKAYFLTDWLPSIAIVMGVIVHQARLIYLRRQCHTFTCPIGAPLVRMAIISKDQLWLTKRPYTGCYVDGACTPCHAAQYCDHPLTSCVNANETPEETISRAYQSTQLNLRISPRFLLKYIYRNSCNQERLIYLYVLNILCDQSKYKLTLRGHFYTSQEIDKGINDGRFTPLFIEEYRYLKQTLLKANLLTRQTTESVDTSGAPL